MSANLFTDFGANATLNVSKRPARVFALTVDNRNAATRYLQLHNTATIPADQAVPLITIPVFGTTCQVLGNDFFGPGGLLVGGNPDSASPAVGLAFAFSTTPHTYTAGTGSEQTTQIIFA